MRDVLFNLVSATEHLNILFMVNMYECSTAGMRVQNSPKENVSMFSTKMSSFILNSSRVFLTYCEEFKQVVKNSI